MVSIDGLCVLRGGIFSCVAGGRVKRTWRAAWVCDCDGSVRVMRSFVVESEKLVASRSNVTS